MRNRGHNEERERETTSRQAPASQGHTSTAVAYFKKRYPSRKSKASARSQCRNRNGITTALPTFCTVRQGKKTSHVPSLNSFHNLLRIVFLLPSLRPALVRFHSAFQLLIRLQVIQTDHLIAARRWTSLFCKSIST